MANPEHVERLKAGVKEWNKWYATNDIKAELAEFYVFGDHYDGVDLSSANLAGCHLKVAGFEKSFLRGSNFSGSSIFRSNFSHSCLIQSDFSDAEIFQSLLPCGEFQSSNFQRSRHWENFYHEAQLESSDWSGAVVRDNQFVGANLREADFAGAILVGCNFRDSELHGVHFEDTVITDCNFSNSAGLDSIRFSGPCLIDYHTIATNRILPLSFFRGCGLSDTFIEYIPSIFSQGMEFYSAFISYSALDKKFARRLHDALQGRGVRCWLDEHEILPGDKIQARIDEGIRVWDKVLLCCSENSLGEGSSWWVEQEVERAFKKERDLRKQRGTDVCSLIPLNLDGFLFSDQCTHYFTADVQQRNAPDFHGWDKDNDLFEEQLEKVVKALRADKGARRPPPKSKL